MKKILLISDSVALHTGFGLVTRKLADYIYDHASSELSLTTLGWFHNPEGPEKRPYRIHCTQMGPNGAIDPNDKWGQITLPRVVDIEKPDIVWALGDMWMIEHIHKTPPRNTFKLVTYHPIDGEPMPAKMLADQDRYIDWLGTVKGSDIPVAFCDWGMRTINQTAGYELCKQWIPHGVDTNMFKPRPREERAALKEKHFPAVPKGSVLVGCFARNQPRKSFDKLIDATARYIRSLEDRIPVYLYLHCALEDKTGWNIPALLDRYGLAPERVITDPTLKVGMGLPEPILAERYAGCDIMALPTRGEGWGLPILEAMSCGVPVITTNYSAHADYCKEGSLFIKTLTRESEPITNIERIIPSVKDFALKIKELAENPELRDKIGEAGRKKALTLDWSVVLPNWIKLFLSIDTADNTPRPKIVEIPEFGEVRI